MRRRSLIAALALITAGGCGTLVDEPSPTPEPTPSPEVTPNPEVTPSPEPAPEAVRFAAVGDIGEGNEVQRRVGNRIAALHTDDPFDVLLLLGDIIYPDGAGHRYETNFAEPWRAVLEADIRMEAALGNHDVQTRRGADIMELFDMPDRYHSFTVGDTAFFALDSNLFDGDQLAWLRDELGATEATWKVIFLHAPAYSSGMHGSTGYVQRGLDPILREYGVQLVVAGHDHNYERTHPIGGTVHIVAGTSCCLRSVGSSDFTAVAFSEPGVFVADVRPDEMRLSFVHSDGRILDEAVLLPDGSVAAPEPAESVHS